MNDNHSTKTNFKTKILEKLHNYYPAGVLFSASEFGGDVAALRLKNLKADDPQVWKAMENGELLNQAITELVDTGMITAKKTALTFWRINLTSFGHAKGNNTA